MFQGGGVRGLEQKSPSFSGHVFVVFENCPITLGENNCAQAFMKQFPVNEPVLLEA